MKNKPTVHKRTVASGAVHSPNSRAVKIARRAARRNASALRGLADK